MKPLSQGTQLYWYGFLPLVAIIFMTQLVHFNAVIRKTDDGIKENGLLQT